MLEDREVGRVKIGEARRYEIEMDVATNDRGRLPQ